jgi:hypothetical protein
LKSRFIIGGNPFVVAAELFDGRNALDNRARKPVPQIVAGLVFQARDAHSALHGGSSVAQ